jgi:hypothetical protein
MSPIEKQIYQYYLDKNKYVPNNPKIDKDFSERPKDGLKPDFLKHR